MNCLAAWSLAFVALQPIAVVSRMLAEFQPAFFVRHTALLFESRGPPVSVAIPDPAFGQQLSAAARLHADVTVSSHALKIVSPIV